MKLKTTVLEILPDNPERTSQDLFRNMLTAARIKFAMDWKIEERPVIEIWEEKLAEYVITAKLNKRLLQEHQQKLKAYYYFIYLFIFQNFMLLFLGSLDPQQHTTRKWIQYKIYEFLNMVSR